MEEEIFTFEDTDGNKVDFNHIASFDVDGVWYAGFAPVESTDEISDEEVVFFRVEDHEEDQELVSVTDKKELDKVWEAFEKLASENDCCCDDDCCCGEDHKHHENCHCEGNHKKGHCKH